MNYDKVSYLVWSIIVLVLILGASILSNYGKSFINDPNFKMFFGWYIALILLNLFNILLNLIYHFFMKDLIGPRGLKGEIGERGPPGQDDKCGCSDKREGKALSDGYDIEDSDKITAKSITLQSPGITDITGTMVSGGPSGSILMKDVDINKYKASYDS